MWFLALLAGYWSHINAVFFPSCPQKCVFQDIHPDCLMLLLDACGGQEVLCMFHLYFLSFITFVSTSFCCCNKLAVFSSSSVLGVHGGTSLVPTGLLWFPLPFVGIFLWRVSQQVGVFIYLFKKSNKVKSLCSDTYIIIVSLLQPDWTKAPAEFGCSRVWRGPKCLRAHLCSDSGLVWSMCPSALPVRL